MTTHDRTGFDIERSDRSPGFNLPQCVGRLLWAPMLTMALVAFPLGFALSLVRAGSIGAGDDPALVAALGHLGTGAMFFGFAAVFGAVAFAIARILGSVRGGGGDVQVAAGVTVETLRMGTTAKAFLATMAMAMMLLVGAVVVHVTVGLSLLGGDAGAVESAERSAVALEAVRRIGVVLYLVSIVLGLATIAQVLRFQAIRLRELPAEAQR